MPVKQAIPGKTVFHTVEALAEQFDVSQRTIRRWIGSGELVAHKFGGLVRVSEEDRRTFVALRRQSNA